MKRDLVQIENDFIRLKNQTAQNFIQMGLCLIEAKAMLKHGEWESWLENNVEYSKRGAQQLMQIAREFGGKAQSLADLKAQSLADLGVTKVSVLLGLPDRERSIFIDTHDIKSMSTRDLQEAVKQERNRLTHNSVIDFKWDNSTYTMPVDSLKPLTDHEKYFYQRKGKEWMYFLKQIDLYGVVKPIVITRDNTIIDGNERVRACKDLGITEIKCNYLCIEERYRHGYTDEQLKLNSHFSLNMYGGNIDTAVYWKHKIFGSYPDKVYSPEEIDLVEKHQGYKQNKQMSLYFERLIALMGSEEELLCE